MESSSLEVFKEWLDMAINVVIYLYGDTWSKIGPDNFEVFSNINYSLFS